MNTKKYSVEYRNKYNNLWYETEAFETFESAIAYIEKEIRDDANFGESDEYEYRILNEEGEILDTI